MISAFESWGNKIFLEPKLSSLLVPAKMKASIWPPLKRFAELDSSFLSLAAENDKTISNLSVFVALQMKHSMIPGAFRALKASLAVYSWPCKQQLIKKIPTQACSRAFDSIALSLSELFCFGYFFMDCWCDGKNIVPQEKSSLFLLIKVKCHKLQQKLQLEN